MAEDQFSSHHPIHPPHGEEDRLDWLRLLRSRRVGPATFYRLMGEHGSAVAALAVLPEVAKQAGVSDYTPCPVDVARAELRNARLAGARMICLGEAAYPDALALLPDPPPLLWALGDISLLARPAVAVIGARNASSLGMRMARAMAEGLGGAGLAVVSGLARGIDTAAHLASLPTGTVAVMAGGVDVVYPSENAVLAQEIADRGLRLSDQPMGLVPQARHFPRRNRIVAGLSRAVVVVEAAAKSGALITARAALDAGREVMAVPGHPMDARASGCNMLIRDGAPLVRGASDVLEGLQTRGAPVIGGVNQTEGQMRRAEDQPARSAPRALPPDGGAPNAMSVQPPRQPEDARDGRTSGSEAPRGGPDPQIRLVSTSPRGDRNQSDPGPTRDRAPLRAVHGDRAKHAKTGDDDAARAESPLVESDARPAPPAEHRTSQASSGMIPTPPQTRTLAETAALHRRILDRLGPSPLAEDQLIRDLGVPASEVGPELLNLELDGRIDRRPGGLLTLKV